MKTRNYMALTLVLLVICSSGCWFRLPRLSSPRSPKKSEKHYDWNEKRTSRPKAIVSSCKKCGDRDVVVVTEETQTLSVKFKDDQEEAALSWWQRVCGWFGGLGTLGIIILIAALIICPGTTVTLLVRWARRSASALKQVVKAVKEGGDVNGDKDFHDALKSNLSATSREIVGRIKSNL